MADVKATRLRCEYLTNPLAIDSPQPRLSWVLESSERGVIQDAYQILVATSEKKLERDEGDLWDSGKVASDMTCQVFYNGKPLQADQDVHWKVRVWTVNGDASAWSEPASWRMGILDAKGWPAKWVGAPGPVDESKTSEPMPSPMLRKGFSLDKPVRRAIATVSALGLYELSINGQRVGHRCLSPEWTNFNKRVQYQAYDVTDLLRSGDNAIGAMLGDGWYAGRLGISHIVHKDWIRAHYGKRLRLSMRLHVEHEDGSTQAIVTDKTWRVHTDGPVRRSCILDGETYDARKEIPGWDKPGFDDRAWDVVDVLDAIDAQLDAQPNEPIRVTEELAPKSITEPAPGVYVVDFGQNMAGVVRIRVRGRAGQTVRMRFAEVLQDDGNIYRDNLRMESLGGHLGARQEDNYTLRGDGEEVYEPHFLYHGFRFMEIVGLESKPDPSTLTARVIHSAPPMAGEFACSSDLLNKLMSNIVWTHRDNMHSVPTDCPQRDERMGWLGDMLVFAQPACFNMDMAAFFKKWVKDIRDAQARDGRYPDIAPHPYEPDVRFSGVPAWGDCGVFVPWVMYVNYGDTRVLAEHFESARRWVDWIHSNNSDLLWKNNRNNDYGDWLNGDTFQLSGYPKGQAELDHEVFGTAFFFKSTELVAKMADIIGRDKEAKHYGKLAEDIRQAFLKAYVKEDGTVHNHTQSSYAIALAFNIVPDNQRESAAKNMVQRIKDYGNHISTGFHTTIMLMNELTRNGYDDVAYMLINNRTMPSWGYTIDHGGTTIWERWDGYVEGRGFQNPAMNSFNHYAIGSVGEWMYRTILGINPDENAPGYRHVVMRIRPGGGLTWARGSYDSIRGPIVSDWKIDGGVLTWSVSIPANTTATVHVPASDATSVTEGAQPARDAKGVKFLREEAGAAVFEVGSGRYAFTSRGWK